MDIPYEVFLAAFFLSLAAAIVAGLLLVVRWRNLFVKKALMSFRYNCLYVFLIILFPITVKVIEYLQGRISDPTSRFDEVVYTNWMFNISGGAIRVLQDRLNSRVLTDLFIIVYVWLFAYISAFPSVLLFAKDDRMLMRKYAIAMLFNGMILTPFYAFFPVSVTGSHPESGMTPLLYISVDWGRMVLSVDPLDNDFPSGHVSIAVTTFLVFATAGFRYRKISYFFGGAAVAIVFSVLYLGIHWPPDVLAGFFVGVLATVLSGVERIQMTIDRYVRLLSEKLLGIRSDEATEPMPTEPRG